MEERQYRNLTLAVLLIVLGVALLLQQLGIWNVAWESLWRFWPLILIFIGLELLLRRVPMGGLIFIILAGATFVLVILSLPQADPATHNMTPRMSEYPRAGVASAMVQVEMAVGRMTVTSLSTDGDALYRAMLQEGRDTELRTSVEVQNGEASVMLRVTREAWVPFWFGQESRFELALTPDVPLNLQIDAGISHSRNDLSELQLSALEVSAGVGDLAVVLPDGEYSGRLSMGVGALRVETPPDSIVRIEVDSGIGSVRVGDRYERIDDLYVTRNADPDQATIVLVVTTGIGTVRVD